MTLRDFLSNISVILAVMAIASLLEIVIPLFADRERTRGRRAVNVGLTAIVFLLNWILTSIAALAALVLQARPTGFMRWLGMSMVAQIVIGALVIDFSTSYLAHRLMHHSPILWRFHRVHHSDDFVDATTTFRTHPVETVWRFLFAIVPVWVFGIPPSAVVIQRLLQAANGVLQHANIRLWRPVDRAVSLVFVTPDVHKIHHSCEVVETNSNYGNVIAVYDRILGTFTSTEHVASIAYGLKDSERQRTESFSGLLSLPFRAQSPYTKVSVGSGEAR